MKTSLSPLLILIFLIEVAYGQIDFEVPERVCVNQPFSITNRTIGATKYFWSFCVADPGSKPQAENLGNIGNNFSLPVFLDFVEDNGNFYAFVTNFFPGGLTRLDFGNSLLNTPSSTYLGNFNGIIPPGTGTEGIQIIKNEGKWYAIIVGGNPTQGSEPRVLKLDFGQNITNPTPIPTNWGNLGNMDQPVDLHIFKENNNWYGFTISAQNNTITRFNFTNSFDNTPTAINLGNIGSLNYPTGIYAIFNKGNWYVFIVNGGTSQATGIGSSLTRLNFGTSLLNTPTGVNLGNPGNILQHPRDLTIYNYCDQIVGFAVNGRIGFDDMVRLDFKSDLTIVPTLSTLGNIGNLNFPHSISKIFRVENDLFAFITNVNNNTLTRVKFSGCTNSNLQGSTDENPPSIVYSSPGTYNISLTIDEGLSTQATLCKQINVGYDEKRQDFSYSQDICNPLMVNFFNNANLVNIGWDFGDGTVIVNENNPTHLFGKHGNYKVRMWSLAATCGNGIIDTITRNLTLKVDTSDIILNADTTICNETIQLHANDAVEYCWSPSTYMDNPKIKNPNVNPLSDITYRLNSKTLGSNLVVNGNFNAGNSGFATAYKFASNNVTEGEYYIGNNPQLWNAGVFPCNDHTGANGNMLMVNGSPQDNVEVWRQKIIVTPNTSYEFSTWLQSLHFTNPAQLQFSINGIQLGEIFFANITQCVWSRFSTIWNSGDSTSATISIVNKNTIALGNDFALDDISFSLIKFNTDSIRIKIEKPFVQVDKDTTVCANSIVQLNATGANRYSWSPGLGLSDTSISNPIAFVVQPIKYYVKGKTLSGCEVSDSVFINIHPKAQITISKSNDVNCDTVSAKLLATGGVNYLWQPENSLSNFIIPNPTVMPKQNTLYKVEVTDANSCKYYDSIYVTYSDFKKLIVTDDTLVCLNSELSLHAEGAEKFEWYPSDGLSNNLGPNPIAFITKGTTYFVKGITANNCIVRDSVNIGSLTPPVIKFLPYDTLVCDSGYVRLSATGGRNYQWSPAELIDNPQNSNPRALVKAPSVFFVEVADEYGCKSKDSLKINWRPKPTYKIIPEFTYICNGNPVEISVSGGDAFQWEPNDGISNPNGNPIIVRPTINTLYKVTVSDNACKSSTILSSQVIIREAPNFGVSKSNDLDCDNFSSQLTATGGVSYSWVPTASLNNANISNPIASPATTTIYYVKIVDSLGCTHNDSITVVFSGVSGNLSRFQLPTAFTPNGDGLNDCFGISKWGNGVQILNFQIFNRWGQVVFKGNNSNICWDGSMNGNLQPSGNYIYTMQALTPCGTVNRKGNLVLIR